MGCVCKVGEHLTPSLEVQAFHCFAKRIENLFFMVFFASDKKKFRVNSKAQKGKVFCFLVRRCVAKFRLVLLVFISGGVGFFGRVVPG